MQHLGQWAAGIIGGVLALAVLFYAANATSAGTYNSALFLFVVLVLFVFAQIKRGFDQAYKARHYGEASGGATGGGSGTAKTGGKTASSGQQAAAHGAQSAKSGNGNGQGAKNGTAKQSGASASSAATAAAAKSGLSETAPSGPTNGTGAKH